MGRNVEYSVRMQVSTPFKGVRVSDLTKKSNRAYVNVIEGRGGMLKYVPGRSLLKESRL